MEELMVAAVKINFEYKRSGCYDLLYRHISCKPFFCRTGPPRAVQSKQRPSIQTFKSISQIVIFRSCLEILDSLTFPLLSSLLGRRVQFASCKSLSVKGAVHGKLHHTSPNSICQKSENLHFIQRTQETGWLRIQLRKNRHQLLLKGLRRIWRIANYVAELIELHFTLPNS